MTVCVCKHDDYQHSYTVSGKSRLADCRVIGCWCLEFVDDKDYDGLMGNGKPKGRERSGKPNPKDRNR